VQRAEPLLPLVTAFLSVAILLGCAVASWLAPSEKKDCLFHREVI
jgi:putative copper export protein